MGANRLAVAVSALGTQLEPDNASVLVAGGGGIALDVTRKLKDAGAWVWMLQRSHSRAAEIEGMMALIIKVCLGTRPNPTPRRCPYVLLCPRGRLTCFSAMQTHFKALQTAGSLLAREVWQCKTKACCCHSGSRIYLTSWIRATAKSDILPMHKYSVTSHRDIVVPEKTQHNT